MINASLPEQPRACARCQFRDVIQQPPPSIEKMKICRLHPRQLTQLPNPQGVMQLQGFPAVADDDWCYQFVERILSV
jgi:hypothetical protein